MSCRSAIRIATVCCLLIAPAAVRGGDSGDVAKAKTATDVPSILAEYDRSLIRDLTRYMTEHPKAEDLDQAYSTIFQKVIDHDWFPEQEGIARSYLDTQPNGAVRPLAQIIVTMARVRAGDFAAALKSYETLMSDLSDPSQEEFASNFAENVSSAAASAGEFKTAREVYARLLKSFASSPTLRQKVEAELARLDLAGKAAPAIAVKDIDGKPVRLTDLKGKYVLVDFWATWCSPCVAELPHLEGAYKTFHAKGFEVIGVSLDETAKPLSDFVIAHKLPWKQVHNATCEGDLVAAYHVGSIPASFLIAPNGTITRLDLRGEALETVLKTLIK